MKLLALAVVLAAFLPALALGGADRAVDDFPVLRLDDVTGWLS